MNIVQFPHVDYVAMTSSSKKCGTGIAFPGDGALFLYHVNEVGAWLHQEWVDIPKNAGRIGRLYLSHEVPDHCVA